MLEKSGTKVLCLQKGITHTIQFIQFLFSKGTCYIFVDVFSPCVVDAVLFLYEELPKHKVLFHVSREVSIYLNMKVC